MVRKNIKPKPVGEYLKLQRRFSHLTPDLIEIIQDRTDRDYQRLLQMEALTNPAAVKKEEPKEDAVQ